MLDNNLIEEINNSASPYRQFWLNQLSQCQDSPQRLAGWSQKIKQQLAAITSRRLLLQQTVITYPEELPVSHAVEQIKAAIVANQLTIVCGETGSGKTTQLPKILLELGYGVAGIIGHTQPRRIAARSLASRISSELGQSGEEASLVGYKMRFHDRTSSTTAIKLMTDGILLQEIQNDKLLFQYSALIIDEVHERSLNIDFILGYLQQLLVRRRDLKVIITSATLENEKLLEFFKGAPLINVSGKTYPVDIVYQPLDQGQENLDLQQGIYQAISSSLAVERGNGLVFLPGEREIKDCLNFLRKTDLNNYQLLALYSRQNNEEQSQIFQDHGRIKIILATNIAETSLTIPGIKFVIDSGIARVKRYSLRNRVEQLQIETISQSSSKQRAGRAGRQSHGLCVRLFSEQEFNLRPQFSEPELLRSNLANVILRLLSLNLGDPLSFPFLDRPEEKSFNDGFRTLFQVGAIDANNQITALGRKLAQIPIDAQLARVLLAAGEKFNCLAEALVVVAFLAVQDPREFPLEQQQLARERHAIWADKHSEFTQMLNLWSWYHEQLAHKKSNKKLLETCHKQFVSLLRLREWHELYRQLKENMSALGYHENANLASYQDLHRAILCGFVVSIGQKDLVENHYQGTNGKKFYLHPSLQLEPAKWLVAVNLVETSRLFARSCGKIEPLWLNGIADHLYKYTYSNEHWDQKRGEVVATKSSLLYGLLISQQKVSLSKINPGLAQELFIKAGLVANQLSRRYGFIEHNLQVVRALEKLEDKLRTSLALLDEELYSFYAAILPPEVVDIPSLEQFILGAEAGLKIKQDEFIERLTSSHAELNLFPDFLVSAGQKLRLRYIFDHDSSEDGLVVILDIAQLNELSALSFEWLVPGMIRDKLAYIIKALPKNQRLQFNPLQDFITAFLEIADCTAGFLPQLLDFANRSKGVSLSYPELLALNLPTNLRCHFRVMEHKKIIASGDNLAQLKIELAPTLTKIVVQHSQQISNLSGFIPELSSLLEPIKLNGSALQGYNSLIVEKDASITFGVVAELAKAEKNTRRGIVQLVKLQLKEQQKYLAGKKITGFKSVSLALIDVYKQDELTSACTNYILNLAISQALPAQVALDEEVFKQIVSAARQHISSCHLEFGTAMLKLADLYSQIKLSMDDHQLAEIIQLQLDDLLYPEFLAYTQWQFLRNFPRYLQAILVRMNKHVKSPSRDEVHETEVSRIYNQWYAYIEELEHQHKAVAQEMYDFKFRIEELRISLFAQEVRTLYPVSSKRLGAELEQLYLANLK